MVNEAIKLFARRSFLVAAGVVIAMSVGFLFLFRAIDPTQLKSVGDYVAAMMGVTGMGQFLAYIVIICTAGIVAREYSQGTIKFLLIRPRSRSQILAAKYVTLLLYTLSLTALTLVVSYVTGLMFFGQTQGGMGLMEMLQAGLYAYIYIAIYATLTFMVGILSRSSGAAVGAGLFCVTLSGLTIPQAFYKYMLFPNTDLSVYAHAGPKLPGMSLAFSAGILAIHAALFLGISFLVFRKRDIA